LVYHLLAAILVHLRLKGLESVFDGLFLMMVRLAIESLLWLLSVDDWPLLPDVLTKMIIITTSTAVVLAVGDS